MRKMQPIFAHAILLLAVLFWCLPLYLAVVAASHSAKAMMQAPLPWLPGTQFWTNMVTVFSQGTEATAGVPLWQMLLNSFIMATLLAGGKVIFALLSAFGLVYFSFPGKKWVFALLFSTILLPIEVRIVPAFQIVATLGGVNHFWGLTLPLMASATALLLFTTFLKTLPSELVDAAKLDGTGPVRFFFDMILPLSQSYIAALFMILFVYAWNQYLWPLLITSDPRMATIVMGIRYLAGVAEEIPQWHHIMCVALVAMLPPTLLILFLQRYLIKGIQH